MTEEKSIAQLAEESAARQLRRGIEQRVLRLRALAKDIEYAANANLDRAEEGKGTYAIVAAEIAHALTWGLANLHLNSLIATAADADIAHAEVEAEQA